jgi:WD40 repeat protein
LKNSLLILLFLIFSSGFEMVRAQNFGKYVWHRYTTYNSPIKENNTVLCMAKDLEGNVWLMLEDYSLARKEEDDWISIGYTLQNTKKAIKSMSVSADNRIFAMAGDGDILVYDISNNAWKILPFEEKNDASLIRFGSKKAALVASQDELWSYKNGSKRRLKTFSGKINDVFTLSDGNALVATTEGLFKFGLRFNGHYSKVANKLCDSNFVAVAGTSQGTIWALDADGDRVLVYEEKQWRNIRKLSADEDEVKGFTSQNANIFLTDNNILVMNNPLYAGLAIFDTEKWRTYDLPTDLGFKDQVKQILVDKNDAVWCLTHSNNLYVFHPRMRVARKKRPDVVLKDTLQEEPEPIAVELNSFLPERTRRIETVKTINVITDSITLVIWDNQVVDGDSISIYYNQKPIIKNHYLSAEKIFYHLALKPGENEILLYAHNLGMIPPNTAYIGVIYGRKQTELYLNSDLEKCERFIINKVAH